MAANVAGMLGRRWTIVWYLGQWRMCETCSTRSRPSTQGLHRRQCDRAQGALADAAGAAVSAVARCCCSVHGLNMLLIPVAFAHACTILQDGADPLESVHNFVCEGTLQVFVSLSTAGSFSVFMAMGIEPCCHPLPIITAFGSNHWRLTARPTCRAGGGCHQERRCAKALPGHWQLVSIACRSVCRSCVQRYRHCFPVKRLRC